MFSSSKKIFLAFTLQERIAFFAALSVLVLSAAVLLMLFVGTATKLVPASGGEYREGMVGQPAFINPVMAQSETDKTLVRLLFSNLKDLASKIDRNEDGRTWKVRLKDDLLWHDGEKLTSDDVIFTIQKIQDPTSHSPFASAWKGVLSQRLSERELQFNLGIPYAFFETSHLGNLYVLPKHLFADIPPANWHLSEFSLKAIGSGPYQFNSYDKEQSGFIRSYRLKANRRYFDDQPFIATLTIYFFPDKERLPQAFNDGHIDGFGNLETGDLREIKRPYHLARFPFLNTYAVFINQNQHLALKEKEVRKALDVSVNREQLGKEVFQDLGVPLQGPIPAFSHAADPDLLRRIPSTEEGSRKLEDAGWKLDAEEVREKHFKNATATLAFTLTVPQVHFLMETANYLARAWKRIGVAIDVNPLPVGEIRDQVIKNREYQLLLFGNIISENFDLYSFWHSSERFHPGLNLSLYNSKRADELLESIRQTFDEETRTKKFRELQEMIAEDTPAVFLYAPDYLHVAANDLRGLTPSPLSDPADYTLGVEAWHLKTARVLK